LTTSVATTRQVPASGVPAPTVLTPNVPAPWASILEAGKPGITRLVTITSLVGFVLSALATNWTFGSLALAAVGCALGTALSALGANTLNEWVERDLDARMPRTAHRPLPQQRIAPRLALFCGLLESLLGLAVLALANNLWASAVSLVCIVTYIAVYTPLKLRSPISTLVGAIPGALPPVIGWTAGAGHSLPASTAAVLQIGGWSLFALMFVWQIPHFLAIAWMYREDYSLGGFKVLAVQDPTGKRTASNMLLWSIFLIPATLLPVWTMPSRVGPVYATLATLFGLAFLYLSARFFTQRTRPAARKVFFASIIHLPVLLMALVAESLVRAAL
jgi:protoheme IX farnesyltransferase